MEPLLVMQTATWLRVLTGHAAIAIIGFLLLLTAALSRSST